MLSVRRNVMGKKRGFADIGWVGLGWVGFLDRDGLGFGIGCSIAKSNRSHRAMTVGTERETKTESDSETNMRAKETGRRYI